MSIVAGAQADALSSGMPAVIIQGRGFSFELEIYKEDSIQYYNGLQARQHSKV